MFNKKKYVHKNLRKKKPERCTLENKKNTRIITIKYMEKPVFLLGFYGIFMLLFSFFMVFVYSVFLVFYLFF